MTRFDTVRSELDWALRNMMMEITNLLRENSDSVVEESLESLRAILEARIKLGKFQASLRPIEPEVDEQAEENPF